MGVNMTIGQLKKNWKIQVSLKFLFTESRIAQMGNDQNICTNFAQQLQHHFMKPRNTH